MPSGKTVGTAVMVLGLTMASHHDAHAQRTPAQQTPAQQAPAPVQVTGVVRSASDSSAVVTGEVRNGNQELLGRTNHDGRFVVTAVAGDTLRIRALGFRVRVIVAASDASGTMLNNASDRASPDVHTFYLEPLPTALPVMITTAGQGEMRLSESSQSVTVVSREEIDGAAAIAVNQLLRTLPGLQEIPSPPSKTSISIRGLDDARVLVLVDGEPTAGALLDNRDIGRMSTVAVQRVEVTKGPSSVEFGSDALGGVINLVTAAPAKNFTVDATARGGALGRRESTVGLSETFGKLGIRVDGGWRQSDRVTGFHAAGSTLERVYDVRTDMRYAVGEHTQLRVNAQGARERQRWPVGGGYNGFIDNRSMQGLAELEQRVAGGTLRARGFAQEFRYQYRQAASLIPIAGTADSVEQQEQLRRGLLSYNRDVNRHRVDAGVQFTSRSIVSPGKVDGDSASDHVVEAFARDAIRIGNVLMNGGVRTTNSSLWGSAYNPSVGLVWDANATVRVRGSFAHGFRAPSFKEVRYTFLNAGAGYAIIGNDHLVPESSWSSSAAVAFVPNDRMALEVELYRNAVENLIDTRYQGVGSDGYLRYQNVNVADAVTEGVETSVRLSLAQHAITAGYTLLHSQDRETRLALSRRSTHTARAAMASTWSRWHGLATDASIRYASRAPVIGEDNAGNTIVTAYQGALLLINAQARLPISGATALSVGVNNLLNQRPNLYSPAFDRQWYVGLQLHWLP